MNIIIHTETEIEIDSFGSSSFIINRPFLLDNTEL